MLDLDSSPAVKRREEETPRAQSVRPARIVVVDDNADLRENIRDLLGDAYLVETYADGAAALAAMRLQRPDLVLTDIVMPCLDGFELLKAIRSDPALQSLPVIVLSARVGNEISVDGYDAGADDYLIKPFTGRELLARVNAHLKMTRLRTDISTHREILAAIVTSSDDAIISKNLDGIITSWNQGAERLFGYTAAEIVGKSIVTLIPLDRHGEEPVILARLRRGERIEHYETVRQHKDGHLLDVSLTVSPLRDSTGRVVGASKIARDITARRRAERQQQALHDMLARVNQAAALTEIYDAALNAILQCLDASRAAIFLFDENEVMRFVAGRGLSEAYRAAVDGDSPWRPDFRHPRPICIEHAGQSDLAPRLRDAIEREGIRALAFVPVVYAQRLRGKLMIYYDTPHAFDAGEVHVAEAIASQIAFAVERQRSAQALESLVAERTRSLREVIAQMEEFSYSVSHDLRSPVRAMRGYAEVMLQEYGDQLDGHGRELLERIKRNGLRMDRLIQDLLTYTRISRVELRLESVSLAKLIADITQQYPEFRPDRATIKVTPGLPAVLAHEPALAQAISNLLSNAVKFIAPGTRPVVDIGFERNDGVVRVWFADNGIAIPPQYQGRLFGMFERLHPDRQYEGTGIGLAIVRRAMERMNGKVGCYSDGIAGSKFWLELPAA